MSFILLSGLEKLSLITTKKNVELFFVVYTEDGVWNVKFNKDCTDIITFWTLFGRYKNTKDT